MLLEQRSIPSAEVDRGDDSDEDEQKESAHIRLTTTQIADIVDKHKRRCFWEDKIDPPRRYFDNQPLGKVILKEMGAEKVLKECIRTDRANSMWFTQLVHSG